MGERFERLVIEIGLLRPNELLFGVVRMTWGRGTVRQEESLISYGTR